MRLLRFLRCYFRHCPGRVVSGWRGDQLMIGFCCNDCGKVHDYHASRVVRP